MSQRVNLKSDVLQEASHMLSEPGRDTRRKILIATNLIFMLAISLHTIIQLISTGTLPDPARDMVIFPILFLINGVSVFYNLRVLTGKAEGSSRKDAITAWASIAIAMLLGISIVHANVNTATSMLVDFGFSVVILFVVGIVLGRRTAIIWFIICAISLFLAYQNVGSDFEYHLMTKEEVANFKSALENEDAEAIARLEQVKEEKIFPLPSGLYVSVWFIFLLIAFFAVFFESNMISKVLGVIPAVIEKINIASQEKNHLEKENMRMGMELDVARKIQMMMLPKEAELHQDARLDIAARMDPASEVGGDFYEFLPQEDGSVICAMGDVTDHGLQSGLVMLMAQSTIRTVMDGQQTSLKDAMNRVNTVLYRNIHGRMEDHRNLTLSLARVSNGSISVCGQHESIFHYDSAEGKARMISTEDLGIYVGLVEDITEHVNERSFEFKDGDIYMFYTDGLTEAEDPEGNFYGEERLMTVFESNASLAAHEIVSRIYEDVYSFMSGREVLDDITLMVLKKKNKS